MIKKSTTIFMIIALLMGCKNDDEPTDPIPPVLVNDALLYSANPNGHNELFLLQNGEETLLLSDEAYDYWWAKVSPDKTKFLVYRSPVNPDKNHDDYENATLMIYDIDGTNGEVLIDNGEYGWSAQGVCRWNEDGTKILMASEQPTLVGVQWRLVITDAEGNNPKVLSDYWVIDPNFSPNNDKIVFIGFPDNLLSFDLTQLELLQGDYDAVQDTLTNIVRLTDNDSKDHDPSYSPDGSTIVFSGGNAAYTNVDIVLYDVLSQTENDVVDDAAANGGSMCFSLDGESIYYHSLNLTAHPFRIKRVDIESESSSVMVQAPFDTYGVYHPEVF